MMPISMLPIGGLIIYLVIFGVGIYFMLLLIKLIKRAIEALDIYIDKNKFRD